MTGEVVPFRQPGEVERFVADAEAALASANDASSAEHVFRQVKAAEEAGRVVRVSTELTAALAKVRLKAERRWGELLGPPAPPAEAGRQGGQAVSAGNRLPNSEKAAQHKAREVAKVPEPMFKEYVETDDPDKLTRTGLLKLARPAPPKQEHTDPAEYEFGILLSSARDKARDALDRIEKYGVRPGLAYGLDEALGTARETAGLAGEIAAAVQETLNEEKMG